MTAVARLEWPGMFSNEAIRTYGESYICKIAREKYLRELHDEQDWGGTFERLKDTLSYVVREYFDGDVISQFGGSRFMTDRCTLPSGQEVSGLVLMSAVARIESPGMSRRQALMAIGYSEAVRIARKKYLSEFYDAQDWGSSFEKLRSTLSYVVEKYLGGMVNRIKSGPKFISRSFALPSGQEVTGYTLLVAVARQERPHMSGREALKDIGRAEAARITREKYLSEIYGEQDWGSTFEKINEALAYVVDNYLDGDTSKVSSSEVFWMGRFTLPSGQRVSGYKLMAAVAMLERPGLCAYKAIRAIGRGNLARIAREKYLFSLDETPESFVQAMRMILDDDGEMEGGA